MLDVLPSGITLYFNRVSQLFHRCIHVKHSNGAFTPEQDNDKTTRQKLNLCIPIMPFTPGLV